MTRRVVVTEAVHPDAVALLRDAGWTVAGPEVGPADACLVRTRRLTDAEVAGFRLIAKHGAGIDNIPLEVARAAGVAVMNTPGANAGAVAEQSLMLMLALARDLGGQSAAHRTVAVRGLEGLRLLVVGFGSTGRRVATLGAAFGMEVTVLVRKAQDTAFPTATVLQDALPCVDVVSLHCPLTPATRHMIDADALALMPPGALLVNCARGGLVEEAALVRALESGHLGGAALDVTEEEPLPPDHPLRRAPRLILTPHTAAMGEASFRRMGMMAAQNILDFFDGRPAPAHIVVGA